MAAAAVVVVVCRRCVARIRVEETARNEERNEPGGSGARIKRNARFIPEPRYANRRTPVSKKRKKRAEGKG